MSRQIFHLFSRFLLTAISIGVLAGCGNTGDLYLPEDAGTTQTSQNTDS